jgi:hypothetical protein
MNKTLSALLFLLLSISTTFAQASYVAADESVTELFVFASSPPLPRHTVELGIGVWWLNKPYRNTELVVDGRVVFWREEMKPHTVDGWDYARAAKCSEAILARTHSLETTGLVSDDSSDMRACY